MAANDALDILLDHDRWATLQMIDACAALSDEQLDRTFEIGRGSVRKTLVHMTNVITGWLTSLGSVTPGEQLEATAALPAIRARYELAANAFSKAAHTGTSADTMTAKQGERSLTAPHDAFFTHLATHGMHHRAQALNMLRHLGVEQPPSSVLQWMMATGRAK